MKQGLFYPWYYTIKDQIQETLKPCSPPNLQDPRQDYDFWSFAPWLNAVGTNASVVVSTLVSFFRCSKRRSHKSQAPDVMVQSSEQLKIHELFCAKAQTSMLKHWPIVGSSKGYNFHWMKYVETSCLSEQLHHNGPPEWRQLYNLQAILKQSHQLKVRSPRPELFKSQHLT